MGYNEGGKENEWANSATSLSGVTLMEEKKEGIAAFQTMWLLDWVSPETSRFQRTTGGEGRIEKIHDPCISRKQEVMYKENCVIVGDTLEGSSWKTV